jgi:hypothetical protein
MSDRPCMLNPEKWRVASYTVQIAKNTVAFRPFQLPAMDIPEMMETFRVWGIWPPQWVITEPPLLSFPPGRAGHRQAFRAAHNRAQFAAVPPIKQPESYVYTTDIPIPHMTEDDG